MKRLLFFFLLLITGISYGQNPCPCSSLRLSNFTGSDPTVNNGNFWYRSDLHKFRIRANNATDNVATEGYVFGNFLPLLLTGDTDVNGLGTLRIGNPDLVEDAITGTWLEIFNDGLFGDYVSIVDQDATLMTSLGGFMQFPAGIRSVPGNSSLTVSSSIIGFESTDNGLKIPTLISDNVTVPTAGKILQEGISMEHYDGSKWRQIVSYGEDDFIIQPSRLYYSAVTDFSGFADSVLVHKKYVDDLFSSGAFWPLTGTGTQTGNVTIDGSDNIGFGVTPTHKLHIQGGSDLLLIEDGDGTDVLEASVENGRPTITVGDINMVGDLIIDEGTNRIMGTATLSSGTVTVNTTKVTANSRIFLTVNGGTLTNVGTPYVSARSAGTSFTITSTNGSDASDVAWLIIEPQ